MWRQLNLRTCHPEPGQLVNLRYQEKSTDRIHYEVGCFRLVGRKLWWEYSGGTADMAKRNHRYMIWWSPVEKF